MVAGKLGILPEMVKIGQTSIDFVYMPMKLVPSRKIRWRDVLSQICSLLISVMTAGMVDQEMGSSSDNYIFYLWMMTNRDAYIQLRCGLCIVQSVRGILGPRVVGLVTSPLKIDNYLLRNSPVSEM